MLLSKPLFPALSLCLGLGVYCAMIDSLAAADAITVKGKRYENIFLGTGADSYYIQDPADGSMITVPKSSVKEKDIEISPDRELRKQLREQWRQRQMNKTIEAPKTVAAPAKIAPVRAPVTPAPAKATAPAPRPKTEAKAVQQPKIISGFGIKDTARTQDAIAVSNVEPHRALEGRKVFMDERGTRVLTNLPEKYSGRPEYVEVTLHFEPIKVPENMRQAAKAALAKKVDGRNSIDEIVDYYCNQYSLDKALVKAIIKVESNGVRKAVSIAGAGGLMQLMPGTAREMGVKDIFDPAENIAGGTQYLATLLTLYNNDVSLALAGYNSGPGNVKKYGGIPPFDETQSYVRRVKDYQRLFKRSNAMKITWDLSKPVDKAYLPPESKQYYQIVLDNGLRVAAEQVYKDEDRYIYTFKGRSGHFAENAVVRVIEPS